jgi:hypothetical protein
MKTISPPELSFVTSRAHSQRPTAAIVQPATTGRLAPTRSSRRPPTCAATTKPRKKYRRTRLPEEADFPRPIWAYSLAKKKMGTKTRFEAKRTRFCTKNGLIRKMLTLISGDSTPRSNTKKPTRIAAPTTTQAMVFGSVQPHVPDCWNPKMLSATPLAIRTRPR